MQTAALPAAAEAKSKSEIPHPHLDTSHEATAVTSIEADINSRLPATAIMSQQPLPFFKNRKIITQSNDIHGHDNFPMGCAFSPDGTCILTATASDGKFRLYDTPYQYLNDDKGVKDGDASANGGDCNGQDENDVAEVAVRSSQHEHEAECSKATTYSHNQNYHTPIGQSSTNQQQKNNHTSSIHPWKASLTSHQGGPPPSSSSASYSWYPPMTSSSPLTSLYLTCRGHSMPIHLIDAYTSQIRASYRPYNGVDEMEGPTVVEFSPDGRRIYGTGFKTDRTIAVFDTALPGREGMIARLGKTRRSSDGQKGIPSAMAFPKGGVTGSGGPSNVFAVGTYSPASIYIYDDRMSSGFNPAGTIVLHGGLTVVGHGRAFSRKKRRFDHISNNNQDETNEDESNNLFSSARVNWFQSRARGGVTQLMWAPPTSNNPYVLFSSSRRSNTILSWDVRALSDQKKSSRPICGLQSYAREGDTNQRLEFDLDGNGKRMFAASQDGVVKIYDVASGKLETSLNVSQDGDNMKDAVNGVSYFPHASNASSGKYDGLLSVAVGSRRYEEPVSDDDEDYGERLRRVEQCPGFLQLHAIKEFNTL